MELGKHVRTVADWPQWRTAALRVLFMSAVDVNVKVLKER